jgi:hypothetical protein
MQRRDPDKTENSPRNQDMGVIGGVFLGDPTTPDAYLPELFRQQIARRAVVDQSSET